MDAFQRPIMATSELLKEDCIHEKTVRCVGLDLAKTRSKCSVLTDRVGCVEPKALRRSQVLPYFARLPRCTVAMETCAGANLWCLQLLAHGHDARLMPAGYVRPYVKSQKNEALDDEAIWEAVRRRNMRYAPVKSEEASILLALYWTRLQLVNERTMNVNRVHDAWAEFGVFTSLGRAASTA